MKGENINDKVSWLLQPTLPCALPYKKHLLPELQKISPPLSQASHPNPSPQVFSDLSFQLFSCAKEKNQQLEATTD